MRGVVASKTLTLQQWNTFDETYKAAAPSKSFSISDVLDGEFSSTRDPWTVDVATFDAAVAMVAKATDADDSNNNAPNVSARIWKLVRGHLLKGDGNYGYLDHCRTAGDDNVADFSCPAAVAVNKEYVLLMLDIRSRAQHTHTHTYTNTTNKNKVFSADGRDQRFIGFQPCRGRRRLRLFRVRRLDGAVQGRRRRNGLPLLRAYLRGVWGESEQPCAAV